MTTTQAGKEERHGEGVKQDRISIGRDLFQRGIAEYTENERELLDWLWGYSFEVLNGSKSALKMAIGYDWSVIHKIWTGKYEASLDRFCEAIVNLRKKVAQGRGKLVETIVTRRITEALDYARDSQSIVAITGPTGRSKTFTAMHWARDNNHGRAKYIRVPSNCSRRTLVRLLSAARGIGIAGKSTSDLEDRIFRAFDFRNTLVIDEAGHLLPRSGKGIGGIEFIRDIHDICGCGVALVFTDCYLDEIKHGHLAEYFEQYIGRVKFSVNIPGEVTKNEVLAVVSSFRKDPPVKLLKLALDLSRNRDGKLRTLFEDMQKANAWAKDHGHDLGFDDLKVSSEWRKRGSSWPDE